jgi:6-phosphogluconate dehydrogenase
MKKADIGLIGLAVMGENLVMNMESKGFTVAVYNRTVEKVDRFIEGRAKNKNIIGAHSLEELVKSLKSPRKIMLMVKAGKPVDDFIEKLIPMLDKGDIIIDGGNSHYPDTQRRTKYVESKGLLYIGTGVSGGEEGALHGPSIMPGGSKDAWPHVKPILQSISAKADGKPCCDWVGEGGAGHYVKMVHNGIEYGDMQLIAEIYILMRDMLKLSNDEMSKIFAEWNKGKLDSYLIEITADILSYKDEEGKYAIDYILDTAGQKGTGKWTAMDALEEGIPLTLIAEAVFARCLSSDKEQRAKAEKLFGKSSPKAPENKEQFIKDMENALYAAKIISYAQGYLLLSSAAKTYGWNLNFGGIALMWRGGCIIRSVFLGKIYEAFMENPELENLLFAPYFKEEMEKAVPSLRRICSYALKEGVPIPSMASALCYYDGLKTHSGSANMVQAQRDYFGAHTYERKDKERGEFFHTNWTGEGGETQSGVYNA